MLNCKKCGKKISGQGKTGLCISCSKKGKNHPNFGKQLSEETRNKMSKVKLGKEFSEKHKENLSKATTEYFQQNPSKHNWYIDGRTKNINYCIDCGIEIDWRANRCLPCSKSGQNNGGYNIERHQVYFCKLCQINKITYQTRKYGLGMCQSCGKKTREVTDGTRISMSLSRGGSGILDENAYYPYIFNKTLKNKIRLRDNFTCQYCGMTQKEHYEKYKRNIEVHHVDYNRFNCKENNLITLCKTDNIKANFNRDYWFAYFTYIKNNLEVIRNDK